MWIIELGNGNTFWGFICSWIIFKHMSNWCLVLFPTPYTTQYTKWSWMENWYDGDAHQASVIFGYVENQEIQPIHEILILTIVLCVKNVQNVMILGPLYTRDRGPLLCVPEWHYKRVVISAKKYVLVWP